MYAIPCPLQVPDIFIDSGITGIIERGSGAWRRCVVGTVSDGRDHLAITASPHPLHNYAKVVNGPAWYREARVRPMTWVTIKGWRMRAVFVPEETNDGSAFANHVVLIWTVDQHTYGLGFHNNRGRRESLLLDQELGRHIRLVGP